MIGAWLVPDWYVIGIIDCLDISCQIQIYHMDYQISEYNLLIQNKLLLFEIKIN